MGPRIPLGLYVHFPWCQRKCPYCDFNSHAHSGSIPEDAYANQLMGELKDPPLDAIGPLQSVFFGGGTPSLISPSVIGRIIDGANDALGFEAGIEITLEANPGTVDVGNIAGYRLAGVNRLSVGIQSFNDRHLARLGRIHSASEASKAIEVARQVGFDNINLDLMYGLPGQSPAEAMADLTTAISLAPAHLSWYQLTIEPNTVFFNHPPQLPHEDATDEIIQAGLALLADNGYVRYEVSAFARPGKQCRHNVNYWEFGDYLGIGAGAHGKLTTSAGIFRTVNTRVPADYLKRPLTHIAGISERELPVEFLMNALRLCGGCSLALFEARTGLAASTISRFMQRGMKDGLLTPDGTIQTTELGLRFLDELLTRVDPA